MFHMKQLDLTFILLNYICILEWYYNLYKNTRPNYLHIVRKSISILVTKSLKWFIIKRIFRPLRIRRVQQTHLLTNSLGNEFRITMVRADPYLLIKRYLLCALSPQHMIGELSSLKKKIHFYDIISTHFLENVVSYKAVNIA